MAVIAAEVAFEEVLEKLAEFEAVPEDPVWSDLIDAQPGPEKTGELGVIFDDDEEE